MSGAGTLGDLPEVARLAARLCEIASPSRREGPMADAVRAEVLALGAEVAEDDAAARIGAGCNNIVARWPGTAPGTPIAFVSHLDTVPNVAPIEVEVVDGHLTNRNAAILGGDDKAAVAAHLDAIRRIRAEGRPHAGIELVFTPCEEIGLQGAAAFDPAMLRARLGFVYDYTGRIGDVVGAAPTLSEVEAVFVGRAAHAGIEPELGRSAILAASRALARMPLGRLDAETTANIGTVTGGTATNVVSERCTVTAEARSIDENRLAAQLTAMLDAMTWAAAETEVDLETRVHRHFTGYRLGPGDPQVAMAFRALDGLGLAPAMIPSGGGSDVNALLANGFPSVNLCNAMEAVHTADERIAVSALETMVDVTLAIVDQALDGDGG